MLKEWKNLFIYTALKAKLNLGVSVKDAKNVLPPALASYSDFLIDEISFLTIKKHGIGLACGICGKRGFTRKGLFLHIKRKHQYQLQEFLEKKIQEIIKHVKKT